MANHAHSTTVPDVSNPDKTQLNRRAALFALPALSGVALLAATARATPASELDRAIERLQTVKAVSAAIDKEMQDIYENPGLPEARVVNYMRIRDGIQEPVYATLPEQIRSHWTALAMYQARQDFDEIAEKIAFLTAAEVARRRAIDARYDAIDARSVEVSYEYDDAIDNLLAIKPATLAEARRKIDALSDSIVGRMSSPDDAARIMRALI